MTTRISALCAIFLAACASSGPGTEPPSAGVGGLPIGGQGAGTGGASGTGLGGVGGEIGGAGQGGGSGTAAGQGGSAGAAMAGAGGTGGMMSGGAGGDSGSADAGVDSDSGWSAQCGDVTHNGHCIGDVYEWCDYYARGLTQLDCGALGMTCRDGLQVGEEDSNGCVGDPCTSADERCDGSLRYDCQDGAILVTDCRKKLGPASSCELRHDELSGDDWAECTRDQPCETPNVLWCDAELEVICDEDGKQYIIDCQAQDPNGRCVTSALGEPSCDPPLWQ